jgi:mono/diheme cytochrome c family protein
MPPARPRLAIALTFALAVAAATAPRSPAEEAAPPEALLEFAREGEVVARLDLATIRRRCDWKRIAIDDPYYGKRKEFLACPLAAVLALGFGAPIAPSPADNYFLRARDGYTKPASGERLAEPGGWLAFADASFVPEDAPRDGPLHPRWEPIERRQLDPAPFYLVWERPGQQDPHRYPWPYQLVRIEQAPFEREYPHTVPSGLGADTPAWRGFAIFRGECIACHAVNGEGGKVGPDLNVPQSIVEYRPAAQIKAYVRDPRAFRYTSMPPHPHLTDADLDALVAYFDAMRARKHDPGAPR